MGRAGVLRVPNLPPDRPEHRRLLAELRGLHVRAGAPSLSDLARAVVPAALSRSTVESVLCGSRLLRRDAVFAVVRVLADRTRGTGVEAELDRFDVLWRAAWLEAHPIDPLRPALRAFRAPVGKGDFIVRRAREQMRPLGLEPIAAIVREDGVLVDSVDARCVHCGRVLRLPARAAQLSPRWARRPCCTAVPAV
ncbi:hypothetical protein [Kitasatospora purpeofusca]|uniref:hypothetical protein n=1 Tax=Kitasatospora purpeofusca TaxID=67352 RepID=UPI0036843649